MDNELLYIRCKDCLSTYTVPANQIQKDVRQPFICSCGGDIKILGRVIHDSVKEKEEGTYQESKERPICDGKCTQAVGPQCNCACFGKNHGTRITVTVIVKEGRLCIQNVDEKAVANAAEWRDTHKKIENVIAEQFKDVIKVINNVKLMHTIPYSRIEMYRRALNEVSKMKKAHLHRRRMNLANKFLIQYGVAVEAIK